MSKFGFDFLLKFSSENLLKLEGGQNLFQDKTQGMGGSFLFHAGIHWVIRIITYSKNYKILWYTFKN